MSFPAATIPPETSNSMYLDELNKDQTNQTITYALPYDYNAFSFYLEDGYASAQWQSAVYAGLLSRDAERGGKYEPELASNLPEISNDGLLWKFNLKPDLKFSNGNSITSDDVLFSYKVALTPAINKKSYGLLSNYFADNSSIIKIDGDTVQFTLSQFFAFADRLFTVPIVDKSSYEENYGDCLEGISDACQWGNHPSNYYTISSGPYLVEKIDVNDMVITLVKNKHYWNAETVKTEYLIFKKILTRDTAISALKSGEIDILDSQFVPAIEDLQNVSGINNIIVGDPAHHEFSLNHLNPYWGTGEALPGNTQPNATGALYVRKAMSHTVARKLFVDEILDGLGQPAATTMPHASIGWDPTIKPHTFNITIAREYMEMAGFNYENLGEYDNETDTYEKTFFNFTMLSPNSGSARNQWPYAFVEDLPKIGIGIDQHVSTGWDVIIPRTFGSDTKPPSYEEGGFDILAVGYSWGLDYNPTGLYTDSGYCDTGDCSNFINYDNDTVEQLINDYTSELDFDKRVEKVIKVQQALFAEIPVIAILFPSSHWGFSDKITGINAWLLSSSQAEWDEISKDTWVDTPEGKEFEYFQTSQYEDTPRHSPISTSSDDTDQPVLLDSEEPFLGNFRIELMISSLFSMIFVIQRSKKKQFD